MRAHSGRDEHSEETQSEPSSPRDSTPGGVTANDPIDEIAESGGGKRPRALSMRLSSAGLILGKAATMGLGFLFWVLAARLFDAEEVGLAAGVVAAMMLCTQLAMLGVGSAVIVHFPERQDRPASLLNTAFTMVGLASLVAGALFLGLAAGIFTELSVVSSTVLYTALFLVMTVTGTLGILFDQVSMALRRGTQVLVRALLFGVLAVTSIAVIAIATEEASSSAIVSPWVVAGAGVCVLGLVQLRRSLGSYRFRPSIDRGLARRLFRVGVPNHLLTLTERAPGLILPIIVTELLSPTDNAHWYAVWMMAWVVFIVPISVGIALFSELVHEPGSFGRAIRHGARISLGFGLAGAVGLALLASVALGFLGDDYSDAGSTPLRILVWAFIPLTFVQVYYATCRARQRLGEAIVVGAVTGVVAVVAAAIVGPEHGLTGMAVAWLCVQAAAGLWALTRVWRLSADARRAVEGGEERSAAAEVVPTMAPGQPAS